MPSLTNAFPTGQRYVPEMLQKHFVDAEGMLWAFDKRAPHRGIWRSKPEGLRTVFQSSHLSALLASRQASNAVGWRASKRASGRACSTCFYRASAGSAPVSCPDNTESLQVIGHT